MEIVPIREVESAVIQRFSSGCKALDVYLKNYARQNDKKDIAKTFLFLEGDKVVGYYSLCNASVAYDELPTILRARLPRYPVPSIRIARLAVAYDEQGKGYGTKMVSDALYKIVTISEITGVNLVLVDAKESSKTFYERFGFQKTEKRELTYVLTVATVRKAFKK